MRSVFKLNNIKNSQTGFGVGYAPAHITCIFEIHNENAEPLKCGSRGIGFCIDLGVTSNAVVKKSKKQKINVILNNQTIAAKTTKDAIKNLIGKLNADIHIFSFTQLPQSQGFGISGAGALSSTLAVNSALSLGLEYNEIVNAAHKAEIENRTGLGDVVAQATGGIVIREHEGGFNFGKVRKMDLNDFEFEIVICILGSGIKTSSIISDTKYIKKINKTGKKYLDKFSESSFRKNISFAKIIKQSYNYAMETGLINYKIKEIIDILHKEKAGLATMIMLGNAILITGEVEKIINICKSFTQPIICKIDPANAKIIG